MALTQVNAGLIDSTSQPNSFKNRIINGAMMIDQRNAGASVTPAAGATYLTDRFGVEITTSSALTFQQSSDAPAGFVNSLKITVASSTAVSSGTNNNLFQSIEGYSIADLGWGTANAKSVTISFWVKSSITGTYSLHMRNQDTYFYIAPYTIDAANTWEYKTITIAGPTSGTWNTTNSRGVLIGFVSLGNGSTFEGTAGSWQAGVKCATSGSIDFCAQANGATFYITGVQLEKGSTATSFDYRPYGTELALCQRYYEVVGAGAVGSSTTNTSAQAINFKFQVAKRATPSITHLSNYNLLIAGQANFTATGTSLGTANTTGMVANVAISTTPSTTGLCMVYTSATDNVGVSAEI